MQISQFCRNVVERIPRLPQLFAGIELFHRRRDYFALWDIGWKSPRGKQNALGVLVCVRWSAPILDVRDFTTFKQKKCQLEDCLAMLKNQIFVRAISYSPIEL